MPSAPDSAEPGRVRFSHTKLIIAAATAALLAGGTAVAASHSGPSPSPSPSQADRLRAIERTRLHALVDADTATARKLTAPDFQLINPEGDVSSGEDYLQALDDGVIDYRVFKPTSPIQVRMSADSASLRFQASFDLVVGGDTHLTHQGWITELYERRDGRWEIVWEQATAIPNDFDLFVRSIEPVA